jgi:hypothetical protein
LSEEDKLDSFLASLESKSLDADLVSKTKTALKKSSLKDGKIGSDVMEAISKCVEVQLRTAVEAFSGLRLADGNRDGSDIIAAAIECGLLVDETGLTDSTQFLLRWFFAERNLPHHDYPTFEFADFLNYFLSGNHVIAIFNRRKAINPRRIAMTVEILPPTTKIGQPFRVTATIQKPDGSEFTYGSVKAIINYNQKFVYTTSLQYDLGEKKWLADTVTSIATAGTFTVQILAVEGSNKYASKGDIKGKLES